MRSNGTPKEIRRTAEEVLSPWMSTTMVIFANVIPAISSTRGSVMGPNVLPMRKLSMELAQKRVEQYVSRSGNTVSPPERMDQRDDCCSSLLKYTSPAKRRKSTNKNSNGSRLPMSVPGSVELCLPKASSLCG